MSQIASFNPSSYRISSDNEFNKLRSVIVGTALGANHPNPDDRSFVNFFMIPDDPEVRRRSEGKIAGWIIEEIEEDLCSFIAVLESFGVKVFRPIAFESSVTIKSPFWETTQLYSLMPRDCFVVVGNTLIEAPSPTRARYFEVLPFRNIFYDHRRRCRFRWISAPKPALRDESYGPDPLEECADGKLLNNEILFDGANCIRIGRDIFIDINRSANRLAADWLRYDALGDNYRIHEMHLGLDHVDVTVVPVRPGLLLVDPKRVNKDNLPDGLKNWEIINLNSAPQLTYGLPYPLASNGIGRNILMLDQDTAVVGSEQTELIRELERRAICVIPLRFRHGRTVGGSFHCVTLDLWRDGEGECYL